MLCACDESGLHREFLEWVMEADDEGGKYRAGAEFVRQHLGPRELNKITQRAVADACPDLARKYARLGGVDDETLTVAEDQWDWKIPRGVRSLAVLMASLPEERRGSIITTNFDPLLEVALRRVGGRPRIYAFDVDGHLKTLESGFVEVVHVHGYWRDTDTLHCDHQLIQNRPRLERALAKRLRENDVFVVGYGGWDDVISRFFNTNVDAYDFDGMDVAWGAFGSVDPSSVGPALDPRFGRSNSVVLYEGVDVNEVLPKVIDRVKDRSDVDLRFGLMRSDRRARSGLYTSAVV